MSKKVVKLKESSPSLNKISMPSELQESKRLVRVKELSKLIDTPAYTIRKLIREGVIPAYRFGKHYLCDLDEVVFVIKKSKAV